MRRYEFKPQLKDLEAGFFKYVFERRPILEEFGCMKISMPEEWIKIAVTPIPNFHIPTVKTFEYDGSSGAFTINTSILKEKFNFFAFQERVAKKFNAPSKDVFQFWDMLPFSKSEYGVDVAQSLFNPESVLWNMNMLDDPFSMQMRRDNVTIPGVTTPYLYAGSYGAPFALHTEDMDLASLSFCHQGAKAWSIFPRRNQRRLDEIVKSVCKEWPSYCDNIQRHKLALIDPRSTILKGLSCVNLTQERGDFVVLDHGAYHEGVNLGPNLAEAINFGFDNWASFARDSKECSGHGRTKRKVGVYTDVFRDFSVYMEENSAKKKSTQDKITVTKDNSNVDDTIPMETEATEQQNTQSDVFEFVGDDSPKPLEKKPRGRKPKDPRRQEKSSFRPSKICLVCNEVQAGHNFNRHMESHLRPQKHFKGISRQQMEAFKKEAIETTQSGVRCGKFHLLPISMQNLLKTSCADQKQFRKWCAAVGVEQKIPEDDEEEDRANVDEPSQKKARHEQNESEPEDIPNVDRRAAHLSAKAKMTALDELYPPMSSSYTIIKELQALQNNNETKDLIGLIMCPVKRILGFAQMGVAEVNAITDMHGWNALLQTERIKEYIDMARVEGGLQPSSIKTYIDALLSVYTFTVERFFSADGMPEGEKEHSSFMKQVKLARVTIKDFQKSLKKKKDEDLTEKKKKFGENLPDTTAWEDYVRQPEVVRECDDSLKALEEASAESWRSFESSPAQSPLLAAFNFASEYLGTKKLFNAARPGELTTMTLKELQSAKYHRGQYIVNVAGHKTGLIKQATVIFSEEEMPLYKRWLAIFSRFEKKPVLAFPHLTKHQGFQKNTALYRRVNVWLKKNKLDHFTSTQYRKVIETIADLSGTAAEKELVGSALEHGKEAVVKHYRVQTAEKAVLEKKTVERFSAEAKLRKSFSVRPVPFDCNIFRDPMTPSQLQEWALNKLGLNIVVSEALFIEYIEVWREAIQPLLIDHFVRDISSKKVTFQTVQKILESKDCFKPISAKVLMAVRLKCSDK